MRLLIRCTNSVVRFSVRSKMTWFVHLLIIREKNLHFQQIKKIKISKQKSSEWRQPARYVFRAVYKSWYTIVFGYWNECCSVGEKWLGAATDASSHFPMRNILDAANHVHKFGGFALFLSLSLARHSYLQTLAQCYYHWHFSASFDLSRHSFALRWRRSNIQTNVILITMSFRFEFQKHHQTRTQLTYALFS